MAVHVGVMKMLLEVPGARSLKDRRQSLKSLQDRARNRFHITWNEVDGVDETDRREVVVTTAGSDARQIRSVLDQVRSLVDGSGRAWPVTVDIDVFPWKPHVLRWQDDDEGAWNE